MIGYGYAGRTFHAPLIDAVDRLRLTVVGSSRREQVQAAHPGVVVCSAMEAATYAEVDLVVIASPNESHHALAEAALRAGKHVVVDKPFTVTLNEARSLAETARQQGRILSVFHNRRWESEVRATKEVLQSGVLGEVSHYECHMDRFRPAVRQRWREDPGPGAGLWFDLGPHLIDQALYLFGLPDSVNASFATLREGGLTEDWAHVQLNYKRLRVVLHASLLVAGGGPRSVLHGTRGSWAKFGADLQEQQLQSGMSPNDPAFGYDASPGVVFDGASGTQTKVSSPRGDQRGFYAAMRDAIRGEGAPPVSVRDAVAVMAILEASFASGAQGRVLPIALTAAELA
ncbi:oxidoreductase [Edaphobacter dinghuensis]|uniref:Oxidoreductase n=1 Tax=Edaphobacter dinghuensis TaxID=1560005 RepID=A0A917LYN2_9BACT|nr:oxidoreductase [Edaphobacter dinghuensis]